MLPMKVIFLQNIRLLFSGKLVWLEFDIQSNRALKHAYSFLTLPQTVKLLKRNFLVMLIWELVDLDMNIYWVTHMFWTAFQVSKTRKSFWNIWCILYWISLATVQNCISICTLNACHWGLSTRIPILGKYKQVIVCHSNKWLRFSFIAKT